MSQNILLVSDVMIKERTAIHGSIDPKLIYPDIKVAQDMHLFPILGTALFEKLQQMVSDGSISDAGNVQYKNLIDRYIVDALIYYTLAELPTTISYQFWNKGVMRKQGQDTELPSMGELIDISNKYRQRAEFYSDRLRKYLQAYATDYFPEYLNPGSRADTVTPDQSSFTMPVYLGGDDNPYCNPGGFNGEPYRE